MSLSDYDPRMIEVWREAATRPQGVVLPFLEPGGDSEEARKKAITQRHRFYRLRKELERNKHPAAIAAGQCKIQVRLTTKDGKHIYPSKLVNWDPKNIIAVDLHFISHNADAALDKALKAVGVKTQEAPSLD